MAETETGKLQPGSDGKATLDYSSSQKKRRIYTVAEQAHPFTRVFQEPLDSGGEAAAETIEDLCL